MTEPARAASREFLISRPARERYAFFKPIFTLRGEAAVGDLRAARTLAHRMNQKRDLVRFPELAVSAGRLYSMALLEEILHWVIREYRRQVDPRATAGALEAAAARHGEGQLRGYLLEFAFRFPPAAVYRDGQPPELYLDGETEGSPNAEAVLEESILLSLANLNQAYRPFHELCDDAPLREGKVHPGLLELLRSHFRSRPGFGPEGQHLIDMLQAPSLASPDSVEGQLEYVFSRWGRLVAPFAAQILTCLDIVREETRPAFAGFDGREPPLSFRTLMEEGAEREDERYTLDRDWMSNVVLMAKSLHVWLHQLSVSYGRAIDRLDLIPDEELATLARRGFNTLWLIGVWERSPASREIKRRSGNPEAESSAYSLWDYEIAASLGGRGALEDLRGRAWARGVRLAADMVPNHVGIYSRWVVEHPDWFISLDHPPFPAYRYTGPDLSGDPSVTIRIEDGYWSRSDAAVAFQRVDNRTGETRYIYHGNDGTGLPWNDTAQLDYLRPEVREAAMGAIRHVASIFPVIRFDAAMTLTKRHYQRLWYPPPGTGGDIPSRAGLGLSRQEFNRRMPHEFWREVVDRAAAEFPDTLLLAEAFWLMEGYFVRTLGMHRVYNSAFMNMMKRESNAEYRQTVKNVLEFDPEILKRFVNFMNNPDEETAVAQFGKGDKYFGTAAMLAAMPGLPMFGHGQVEGFTEKYGMEYRRAYRDEEPDAELVARHEREIFPLLRRRPLFSHVDDFTLYDLWREEGRVDENVFAFSNRRGAERCLVVYHNVWGDTAGWIRDSAAMLRRTAEGRRLARTTLGQALGLHGEQGTFVLFTDAAHGLEYIRPSEEMASKGLFILLGAFQYHVFVDFRQVRDDTGVWAELCRLLNGRGVESLEAAMREIFLTPLHRAFRAFFNPRALEGLAGGGTGREAAVEAWLQGVLEFLPLARQEASAGPRGVGSLAAGMEADLAAVLSIEPLPGRSARPRTPGAAPVTAPAASLVPPEPSPGLPFWRTALAWTALRRLGEMAAEPDPSQGAAWLDEWMLGREAARVFRELGASEQEAARDTALLRLLVEHQGWLASYAGREGETGLLEGLLSEPAVQSYLGFNRYQGVLWLVRERLEELVAWLHLVATLEVLATGPEDREERDRELGRLAGAALRLLHAAGRSGYMVERFLAEAG